MFSERSRRTSASICAAAAKGCVSRILPCWRTPGARAYGTCLAGGEISSRNKSRRCFVRSPSWPPLQMLATPLLAPPLPGSRCALLKRRPGSRERDAMRTVSGMDLNQPGGQTERIASVCSRTCCFWVSATGSLFCFHPWRLFLLCVHLLPVLNQAFLRRAGISPTPAADLQMYFWKGPHHYFCFMGERKGG